MKDIHITALRHSAFYTPLIATMACGFLRDEGLNPVYRLAPPGAGVRAALETGAAHVAQSAVATHFAPLAQGERLDVVHFAQINARDGFYLTGRHAQARFAWADLVGKTVLVDHLFQPLAMFQYAAFRSGVDWKQIRIVDAGDVEAMDRAFRAGQGDYVHQQGPAPQQLEYDGLGYLVASVGEVIGPVAFSSLCARRDWLATDMALAFMRAYRRGQRYALDTPPVDIAAQIAEFFPTIATPVLQRTIANYQALGCWTTDARIERRAYETTVDVFLYSRYIERRIPYDSVVVNPPDEPA